MKGEPAEEAPGACTLPVFLPGWGWGCTGCRLQGGLCHADSEGCWGISFHGMMAQRGIKMCRERQSQNQVYLGRPTAPVFLLQINDQRMATPYNSSEHLRAIMQGHRLYLITDFEMVVSFGGRNNAGT